MITVTETAADKVLEMIDQMDAPADDTGVVHLRIGVKGGGCSGFQYELAFDDPTDADEHFDSNGVSVIVARDALRYVSGSSVEWVDGLMSKGFQVNNPNVIASCGCGSSFRVDDDDAEDALVEDDVVTCNSCL